MHSLARACFSGSERERERERYIYIYIYIATLVRGPVCCLGGRDDTAVDPEAAASAGVGTL